MALDLRLPVLPITIVGTREILPPGSRDLRPGRARLIIHEPVVTENLAEESHSELLDRVREIVERPLDAATG